MTTFATTHETPHSHELAHHFESLEQQREAAELGMWLFLATEFMFFGGLFLAYVTYRSWYPQEFAAASATLNVTLGTLNTLVLLTSSLTMALAVQAAHAGRRESLTWFLVATLGLGGIFLGVKAYEYHHKYEEKHIPFAGLPFEFHAPSHADTTSPPSVVETTDSRRGSTNHAELLNRKGLQTFFNLYFLMTGFHALHMLIGMAILAVLVVLARRGGLRGESSIVVHNVGMYWHLVDLVWVYLFPFLYLVASRGSP